MNSQFYVESSNSAGNHVSNNKKPPFLTKCQFCSILCILIIITITTIHFIHPSILSKINLSSYPNLHPSFNLFPTNINHITKTNIINDQHNHNSQQTQINPQSNQNPTNNIPNSNLISNSNSNSNSNSIQNNKRNLLNNINNPSNQATFGYPLDSNDNDFPIKGSYDDVHFVFTTGCTGYQNWQSETLLYSWAKIGQPGRITRVIAGCKTDDEKLLANTTGVPNDFIYDKTGKNKIYRINWYFVSDYTPSKDDNKGIDSKYRPFHYFNKPYGMQQWLHNYNKKIYESVIICIDPDMIILKKFLFHLNNEMLKQFTDSKFIEIKNNIKLSKYYVREGHPVSQKYGIGPKWIKWTGFCDDRPGCQVDERTAWDSYSIGPPYMMHKNDWLLTVDKWVEFSPGALEWEPQPSILAEMYSYSMASAYYDLKHFELLSMVSAADSSPHMEAWNDINWDFLSNNPTNSYSYVENTNIYILHYCQGYWLGQSRNEGTIRIGGWNWHKGHVPLDFLYNCEIPLFVELGQDSENGKYWKEMYESRDEKQDNRHTWILYHLYRFVNQAAANYKLKYCKNWMPEYKLVLQQPESDRETHRRMNYILGDYESKLSWRGN